MMFVKTTNDVNIKENLQLVHVNRDKGVVGRMIFIVSIFCLIFLIVISYAILNTWSQFDKCMDKYLSPEEYELCTYEENGLRCDRGKIMLPGESAIIDCPACNGKGITKKEIKNGL